MFANFINRIGKRKTEHYNALIRLEYQLVKNMNIILDNQYIIPGYRKIAEEGNIFWGSFQPLISFKSQYINIHNIELINKVLSFDTFARKISSDLEDINKAYSEVKEAYISRKISREDYIVNVKIIVSTLDKEDTAMNKSKDQIYELLAYVRIAIKKDQPLSSIIRKKFIRSTKVEKKQLEELKNIIKIEAQSRSEAPRRYKKP